ncbi:MULTISPECIES: DUF6460 domain-containing protein [Bartonella]|uniref:DUF6460 domain-containing protein n=1 Tax=Bartonella tribocorum (strain DSM 28219 / CCUG 45778 / CIP 105476 / IBS 506) TaxID=382640 RepID=A9IXB4_BART1|nr:MULTISPECIES: DUF6460 domain-containing protein [Bartonella]CAK02142.1 conserved hypothetical protein [Bartonella tribocorum CIP 105476]
MNRKKKLSNSFHAFLGGTFSRVSLKLLILSFFIGIVMKFFGWTPRNLTQKIIDFLQSLWERGFITLTNFFHITMMGAIIVVPIFLISRIFHKK